MRLSLSGIPKTSFSRSNFVQYVAGKHSLPEKYSEQTQIFQACSFHCR